VRPELDDVALRISALIQQRPLDGRGSVDLQHRSEFLAVLVRVEQQRGQEFASVSPLAGVGRAPEEVVETLVQRDRPPDADLPVRTQQLTKAEGMSLHCHVRSRAIARLTARLRQLRTR
jgi:hypothetical protein